MSKACNKCCNFLTSMHRLHKNLRMTYCSIWLKRWSKIGISPMSSLAFQGMLIARYPVTTPSQSSRTLALTAKRTDEAGMHYLQDRLQLDTDEVSKIHRKLMFCPGRDRIKSSLDGVKDHLKLSNAQLRKMILTLPAIIGINFDNNIKPTLDSVRNHLNLTEDELRKMILTHPSIIVTSFDDNIKPTLDAVQNYLKLSDDELRKMILSLPAIICYSFDNNTKPTLDTLQYRLEISDSELKKMVVTMPSIIGYSNIVPKLDWLQTTFNLNQFQLVDLVNKQKMLMSVNLEKTLVPGVAFWRECFKDRTDVEAMAEIARIPRELTQSNKRLQKRSALFKERFIPQKLLWGKAAYTDDRLDAWIERHFNKSLNSTESITVSSNQSD